MLDDVVIVGAGPVGATLALALADGDLEVVVLDARAPGETLRGDRSLALSHGARLIMERIGVWGSLAESADAVTPITRIDISQAGGFGAMQLAADEQGLPALGYVVSYRALQRALDAALARTRVAVRHRMTATEVGGTPAYAAVSLQDADAGPLLARLAAVADGTGASVAGIARRRHDYGQVALIAKVWTATPHAGLAYERFTPEGPMALLPEGDHYGLVWTATPERGDALLAIDDELFLAELAQRFGKRAGAFEKVGERRTFPLAMEFAAEPAGVRRVVLGNAAQTLHPVAGQGFNVGLRDAWELAQIVLDTPRDAIGDRAMLDRYSRARRTDRIAGIAFTHGLVGIFGNDVPLVRWPRGLALTLLGAVPAAKRAFARAMLFGLH
ncbi:MAG TPA: FAD-dependent monooxygenase [Casimicrobiaceae bacterium]|nr:FAD-dependent monooxygenase [Casimicrobiaceae bacterium]